MSLGTVFHTYSADIPMLQCGRICTVQMITQLCCVEISVSKSSEYGLTIALSNKYHRQWCTLLVCPDWVGHSGVTNARFSPTVCSALWLMAYCPGDLRYLNCGHYSGYVSH